MKDGTAAVDSNDPVVDKPQVENLEECSRDGVPTRSPDYGGEILREQDSKAELRNGCVAAILLPKDDPDDGRRDKLSVSRSPRQTGEKQIEAGRFLSQRLRCGALPIIRRLVGQRLSYG